MTNPVTLFRTAYAADRSAAFVGDGFLVASRMGGGLGVARVEVDGTKAVQSFLLQSGSLENPRLASAGGKVHLTYDEFAELATSNGTFWEELNQGGVTVLGPTRFADFVITSLAGIGTDTLMLYGAPAQSDTSEALDFVRLGADGQRTKSPIKVVRDPTQVRSFSLALLGGSVVAAWITGGCPGTIDLALISP